MNRQFTRNRFSSLVWVFFCAFIVCSFGCDLGTYNKRFKERNAPATAKKSEKAKADDVTEDADNNKSADSE